MCFPGDPRRYFATIAVSTNLSNKNLTERIRAIGRDETGWIAGRQWIGRLSLVTASTHGWVG
jgi:hypothetical protein